MFCSRYFLILLLFLPTMQSGSSSEEWSCDSEVYCKPDSGVLHTVQTNKIFQDSKTFVDMPMKFDEEEVLKRFKELGDNPTKEKVKDFVLENFYPAGTELRSSNLSDWKEHPGFVDKIQDEKFKKLAEDLHARWKSLAKEIPEDVNERRTTLIPLKHPFIVPGGRFLEIYYWDSYWTIKGLLHSELYDTVKGMLLNFKELIERYGHIPNGNRIYYIKRSQPPFYSLMVDEYIQKVAEIDPTLERYLYAEFVESMDLEFKFWQSRFKNITVNGSDYEVAVYNVEVDGPRPESYSEDYQLGQLIKDDVKRKEWYGHMKSGAESGWDYSSRWYSEDITDDEHPLLSISTGSIVPVDLNSILCRSSSLIAKYYRALERVDKAAEFQNHHHKLKSAIRNVLWNPEDEMWYDFHITTSRHNRNWYASNLFPLYCDCLSVQPEINKTRLLENLKTTGILDFPGGLPTSLFKTEKHPQQWDFPNMWPPLVEVFITAMETIGTDESKNIGTQMASKFLNNVAKSSGENSTMFEKYSCESIGTAGGGGEYPVQEGFGWTNGVTLDLLNRFPNLTFSSSQRKLSSDFCLLSGVFMLLMINNIFNINI